VFPDFENLFCTDTPLPPPHELGRSRAGRPVVGFRLGTGTRRVSLIGGCHADEPVGPMLLERLVRYLASRQPSHPLLAGYEWWIVPHVNPDGAERNAAWSRGVDGAYDLVDYLGHVVREAPGDDIEFGFPRDAGDRGARPENRALYDWWTGAGSPFLLHASLHGMAFAGGPWFLIDAAWAGRCRPLRDACAGETAALGYGLHDVERHGDKGFHRIERGFCTRPDSGAMAKHFLERGDKDMAARFRPSSMETMRSFGGDTLTLVSEIPLFITPGVGERIDPDPVAGVWRERIAAWKAALSDGDDAAREAVAAQARDHGMRAVPIVDQMRLQWRMIVAGLSLPDG
jgi:hypothetical protein